MIRKLPSTTRAKLPGIAGVAVLLVGEDLDVLLELCDRILVLCSGKVNGIVDGRSTTKEEVGLMMTNLRKEVHRA